MRNLNTVSETHDHPLHLTNRGRLAVGGLALTATVLVGSYMGIGSKTESRTTPSPSNEQIFESQVNYAIKAGPENSGDIIGIFPVAQDRTIGNAILQESNNANYPIDINEHSDSVIVTLSSNAFSAENGPSYQPEDTFMLFQRDVDGDGKKEILAKSSEKR